MLGLDSDPYPKPRNPNDRISDRPVPEDAWDLFAPTRADLQDAPNQSEGVIRGARANQPAGLPPRLASIGVWIQRVAHQPLALWWAAQQNCLHPNIRRHIESTLRHEAHRFPENMRRGWRLLFAAWDYVRTDPDHARYDIEARAKQDGWNPQLIRELAAMYRPYLRVAEDHGTHPLFWGETPPDLAIRASIEYPHPHAGIPIPPEQLYYATSLFRQNLEVAIALEKEIKGHDHLHFYTTRGPDDGSLLTPEESYGLTIPLLLYQNAVSALGAIDRDAARAEIASWPSNDDQVYARLRIWAAGTSLQSGEEAAAIVLGLSENAFWGSQHQRDLLYALRDKWAEFAPEAREAIERRMLTGAFPWEEMEPAELTERNAYHRLNLLYWLSQAGVAFLFDVDAQMAQLKALVPEWTEAAGEQTADSQAPKVYSMKRDPTPDPLLAIPVSEILKVAEQGGRRDFRNHTEFVPFRGLSERYPARALAALTHVGRKGLAPRSAWSTFLYAEQRLNDPLRLIRAVAARIIRLPDNALFEIAYPVSDWMNRIRLRLYSEAPELIAPLWDRLITVLPSGADERRHGPDNSWADDALNAPVGKLHNFLNDDPAKKELTEAADLPPHWSQRLSQLLHLPGEMRQHALVMISFQTRWLYFVDPVWTERELLPAARTSGPDSEAFWDGYFWHAHTPQPALYEKLKAPLIVLAGQPRARRHHTNIMAGILLDGWGGVKGPDGEPIIGDLELREILIDGDDELRARILWYLRHWAADPEGHWRPLVIPFFNRVWPKQRALRTPSISARLADFAIDSGDMMPTVVDAILPRLIPVRGAALHNYLMLDGTDTHPARRYPAATLDLLWAILAEDPRDWPYKIETMLDLLAELPETSADPRLSELRRRRRR